MSAVRQRTQLALGAGLALILIACGASPVEEEESPADTIPVIDLTGSAGRRSDVGFKGWRMPSSAGAGGASAGAPAAVGGSSGTAGEVSAAGSGGAAGAAGAAGSAPTAGSGASAPTMDPFDIFGLGSAGAVAEDPFNLFGGTPGAVNCAGLLCFEAADCQNLYPAEHAACNFTQCVDLQCK